MKERLAISEKISTNPASGKAVGGLGSQLVVVAVPLASSSLQQGKGFSLLPPCFSGSLLPAISSGLSARVMLSGASPMVPALVAMLSCSREEVSQAEGFPLANLRWFHLKNTKH